MGESDLASSVLQLAPAGAGLAAEYTRYGAAAEHRLSCVAVCRSATKHSFHRVAAALQARRPGLLESRLRSGLLLGRRLLLLLRRRGVLPPALPPGGNRAGGCSSACIADDPADAIAGLELIDLARKSAAEGQRLAVN